jgi:DNA-directed RNA polymerase sigma subunit (sigma70/sigma32)
LEEIAALPAQGDEELLAAELAENNRRGADDSGLCTRLVNLSLARVVELASEYMQHGVLLLDLIQEGSMGLWKAILSYTGQDMFHNERDWWIRFCMTKAVIFQARESGIGSKLRRDLEVILSPAQTPCCLQEREKRKVSPYHRKWQALPCRY